MDQQPTQPANLEVARRQIQFARDYTLSLLADIPDQQWFAKPAGISHVAWQVGHLAVAEYGLVLFRQRGRRPEDNALLSSAFRRQFGKGSQPESAPEKNPSPAEIRQTLAAVHQQALSEMEGFAAEELHTPVDQPYAAFPTRLGALLFCAAHEMMHAGQIGLLRRELGMPPIR